MIWAIQTSALTKCFPKSRNWRGLLLRQELALPAVDGVDLSVRDGELFGLVGPNGAGKTTLIKMLATLVLSTSGTARVNGFELSDEINIKRSIGLVTSDERSFYWRLTGRQNLEFFAALNAIPPNEVHSRVTNVLGLVGLQNMAGKRFQIYSTGMRQRLSIARALLAAPRILFLDEPTKGLDPAATRQLHELIRGQLTREQGMTVFMSSHRLDEVERLCDRVAVMSAGRVRACGSMADLRGIVAPRERYQLQVRGWSLEIQTEIERLVPGVVVDSIDEHESLLEFNISADGDTLNRVIDTVRGRGGSIQSLSRERASLDDIFDQITSDDEHDNWLRDAKEAVEVSLPAVNSEAADRHTTSTLSELWRVARAFLKRDLRSEMSYRFSFFLQFFNVIFSVAVFYFVAQLLGESATPYLEPYGGDYFSFVLIGIAFAGYFGVGLSSFSNSLRTAQTTGTLEAMLSTPTRLSAIILSSSQWSYLMTTLRVIVYLLVGTVFLGVDIGQGNYWAALLILVLTVVSFSSLGIMAASFIMVLKRGDPVTWIFGTLSSLLGGVYYPLAVMPQWMQAISNLLPITYALRAMRLALLQGASFSELMPDILALGAFCVILLPASLLAFGYAVKWARRDGSLTHY